MFTLGWNSLTMQYYFNVVTCKMYDSCAKWGRQKFGFVSVLPSALSEQTVFSRFPS